MTLSHLIMLYRDGCQNADSFVDTDDLTFEDFEMHLDLYLYLKCKT